MQSEQLRQDYLRGFEEVRVEVLQLIQVLVNHPKLEVKVTDDMHKVKFSNGDTYTFYDESEFEIIVNKSHNSFMRDEYDNINTKIELAKLKQRLSRYVSRNP